MFAHDFPLSVDRTVFQSIHALTENLLCAKRMRVCSMTLSKSFTHSNCAAYGSGPFFSHLVSSDPSTPAGLCGRCTGLAVPLRPLPPPQSWTIPLPAFRSIPACSGLHNRQSCPSREASSAYPWELSPGTSVWAVKPLRPFQTSW